MKDLFLRLLNDRLISIPDLQVLIRHDEPDKCLSIIDTLYKDGKVSGDDIYALIEYVNEKPDQSIIVTRPYIQPVQPVQPIPFTPNDWPFPAPTTAVPGPQVWYTTTTVPQKTIIND